MPPKKRARVATSKSKSKQITTRRSTRRTTQNDDQLPDVYQEMLADLPDDDIRDERPTKRRKASPESENSYKGRAFSPELVDDFYDELRREKKPSKYANVLEIPESPQTWQTLSTIPREIPSRQGQVIYNDAFSDSDGSEEFEDVEINGPGPSEADSSSASAIIDRASKPVTISFNSPAKSTPRRKRITKADRLHRLAIHKWHFLCLLLHMATVNKWCNNAEVQASLKKIIPRKLISRLHRGGTQAERKFAFDNSMIEVSSIWQSSFKKTEPGMRRARWRDVATLDVTEEMENAPEPIDFDDFKEHAGAGNRQGTRDLGAQLFCALCRALAIDARLVCSLQVLPFAKAAGKSSTRSDEDYLQAGEQDFGTISRTNGQSSITESPRPIWWVEVLNPAIDQWMAIDPRSGGSYNQPRTRFEPPASDALNNMSYVIAFEEDGSAKDVTRRYASAYNAKTRKTRVENTKDGAEWMARVMSVFAKKDPEPRDQIEDAELSRRVALEGMPRNVQDFKDHPIYVLERHIRSNEVIEPKKECGRLKVGRDKVEIVYRREHLHACRTADGWYRKGRNVRDGMQPLRLVPKRRGLSADDPDEPFAALYSEYQTEVYQPPEVMNGRVPRNGFGNLDVYVPTMIPMGGVHIRHPFAIKAAKALGIDHVEAVTGFKFKGRQGTAILDGVVVASEHLAIMTEVISKIEDDAAHETNDATDAILERLWAVMLRSLRIRQMVQQEYGEGPTRKVSIYDELEEEDEEGLEDADDVDDEDDLTYDDADEGGGFTVEAGEATAETRAEEAAQLSNLRDNRPVTLPAPIVRQKIIAILSPHKPEPKPSLPKQDSFNDLFDDEPDAVDDQNRSREWAGMTGGGEVEGGGFITTPQDSPGSWDSGIASNMQDQMIAGGWYTDYMMSPSDLPIRDYMSEITPSPDPISTPDYPHLAALSRENKAAPEAEVGEQPNIQVAQAADPDVIETESLLSHDPDDDDAEPEWVAEAFDE